MKNEQKNENDFKPRTMRNTRTTDEVNRVDGGGRWGSFFEWELAGGLLMLRLLRTVIYPGSFDPLTNGHLDVIQRATKLFDRVIVAVALNEGKKPVFFTQAERLDLVARCVKQLPNVETDAF